MRQKLFSGFSLSSLFSLTPTFSFATPPADSISKWQYILLAVFVLFCCFYGMGAYPILDMNEGLYAEIAREMLTTGNYIVPHLNGVAYLEKPPLLYWLIAMSFHTFGINAFAARLVPCAATLLTVLTVFYFARQIQTPRIAWIAAMLLATSMGFVVIGHVVFFDMLLTWTVTACLASFYLWYQTERNSYLYSSYIFLGLAVLTKGFVTLFLLPLIALIFLRMMRVEKERYHAFFNKKAIIVFLAIIVPWHLLAMSMQPGFTWEYFINNQVLRFFNMRVPHDYHTGPIYYYIPLLIGYLLPWSLLLPFLVRWPLRFRVEDPLRLFMWIWFLVMFIFFTLSGDKGSYYLIIGTPPLAYLLALKIDEWFGAENSRWLTLIFLLFSAALTVAAVAALILFPGVKNSKISPVAGNAVPYMLMGALTIFAVVMLIYTLAGFYLSRRHLKQPFLSFLLLCGLIVPALIFFTTIKEKTYVYYSQVALASYLSAQYENRPVYLYRDFERISSFVFYNHQVAPIVDSQSKDLYFGSTTAQAKNLFISLPDFMAVAQKQLVYLVTRVDNFASFNQQPGAKDFCTVQRNGDVLLLSNAPQDCRASLTTSEQKALPEDLVSAK